MRTIHNQPDEQQPLAKRALSVIGCVSSGLGDPAANHDDYLTDAFQE